MKDRIYGLEAISIHALLAESDQILHTFLLPPLQFQSTLSSRRATLMHSELSEALEISIHALLAESDSLTDFQTHRKRTISIHALLAESDIRRYRKFVKATDFNPRSPRGERRRAIWGVVCSRDFNPRSPRGERPYAVFRLPTGRRFQSTLSSRRATLLAAFYRKQRIISIHALLAESDMRTIQKRRNLRISIHALLAESDIFVGSCL